MTTLESIISRLRDLDEGRMTPPAVTPPTSQQRMPRSSPASPATSKKNKYHPCNSPIRSILNSPLLNRRLRKKANVAESSDDEGNAANASTEDSKSPASKHYRDLETFQKAQLRQKVFGFSRSSVWLQYTFQMISVKTRKNRTKWNGMQC